MEPGLFANLAIVIAVVVFAIGFAIHFDRQTAKSRRSARQRPSRSQHSR